MKKNSALYSSEWLLAGSLGLLLVSLLAIAKIQSSRFSANAHRSRPPVEVAIEGFVNKPGVYYIAFGAPLEEALRKSHPKRFANLRTLDGSVKVEEPLHLIIEKLDVLKIYTTGAVASPGVVEVPSGTRICDLKKWMDFSPNADFLFFKKRRFLTDGETICIPFRKE